MTLLEVSQQIDAQAAARSNIAAIVSFNPNRSDHISPFVTPVALSCIKEMSQHQLNFGQRAGYFAIHTVKHVAPTALTLLAGICGAYQMYSFFNDDPIFEAIGKSVSLGTILGVSFYALNHLGLMHLLLQKFCAWSEECLGILEHNRHKDALAEIHQSRCHKSLKEVYDAMAEEIEFTPLFNQELLDTLKVFKSRLPLIHRAVRKVGGKSSEVLNRLETVIHHRLLTSVVHGSEFGEHNAKLLAHLDAPEFIARMHDPKTMIHLKESRRWIFPISIVGIVLTAAARTSYTVAQIVLLLFFIEWFKRDVNRHRTHTAQERSQADTQVNSVFQQISAYFRDHANEAPLVRGKLAQVRAALTKDGFNTDALSIA